MMELGRHLPLELTLSCLSPIDGLHCGNCNKCGERRRAFKEAGMIDRTRYALPAPAKL
jgi:7-cyano-7-deazaguanine synthase